MGSLIRRDDDVDINQPLVPESTSHPGSKASASEEEDQETSKQLASRIWIETRKLWKIVGPAIFSRVVSYSMNVITQAFAGHLGEVELAAISIANTVIVGFNFGLLLGMASALETLCGQAFGAKRYRMLGIYLQRSWIVLFLCCFLLLPFYIFASPILKLLGQPDDVAESSGLVACWLIPLHFSFAFQFPLQRFLQSQLKNIVIAWVSLAGLLVNVLMSWLLIYVFDFGLVGAAVSLDVSWWVLVFGLYGYTVCGGCPLTWSGFSMEAFSGLWEFLKLSAASGVMLCLENWYYRILILMTGFLQNATLAVDALSVCMTINGWELMIPLAFFAGTGVRVANELGAGNGKAAKFATIVSVTQSSVIGVFFCVLIMILHNKIAYIFSSDTDVLDAVDKLSLLLAATILLNSVQPVLSGVAVGSGWQAMVAYINLGCYYIIGLPLGILMGLVFDFGVMGIWGGMVFGGTAVQTVILAVITIRCDWEKQAEIAQQRVNKWTSTPKQEDDQTEVQN
ncbi:protein DETOXIFICATION 27-like [Juglans microcarpa x Juglans regia]|uniref:protein DETOXIFICATION 27-like n=1 Tax=Juglans microcarpa x Juglans regia TaxID=2249226 RepID=UPI001B7E8F92|nr:protein DETOXIFICATION 27-like [Juglans microcarpa x Juglans regia]